MWRCEHVHAHTHKHTAHTHMHMYMHTHVCTHSCTHTYIPMHADTIQYAHTNPHIYVYTHTHMHAPRLLKWTHVAHKHTKLTAHTHTHTHMHMHTFTLSHTPLLHYLMCFGPSGWLAPPTQTVCPFPLPMQACGWGGHYGQMVIKVIALIDAHGGHIPQYC